MLEVLVQLFKSTLQVFLALLNPIFLIPLVIFILVYAKKIKEYKAGTYYQITKVPYFSVRRDLGKWGEYLTYKYLKEYEKEGAKFLFNVYIPKENGETTEIDVLMISRKGIFVFESKNYSGWIFGSERQKNWYQTLPAGKGKSHKEHFYNPIMQNRSHIKHLKSLIGDHFLMHSIIAFSERCTLKNVEVQSSDINVINRNEVGGVVLNICKRIEEDVLTEEDISNIYNRLYPLTQISSDVKIQHITNIQNNLAVKSVIASDESCTAPKKKIEEHHIVDASLDVSVEKDDKLEANESHIKESEDIIPLQATVIDKQDRICPRCGGNLVLRTANRGINTGKQFWGCTNYPKCRYIRNIDDINS